VVLTQDEVGAVLAHLSGTPWIMATLLYGAGLRLRVQDVDFPSNHIVVRDGKGHKDRVTMLPQQVKAPIQRHLHDVKKALCAGSRLALGTSTCHMHWSRQGKPKTLELGAIP
jgi:integrase